MLSLSILATLWFWVVIVEVLVIIYAVHEDEFLPPIFGLALGVAVLHFGSDLPVIEYIKHNYQDIITYAVYYVLVGLVWSVVKWYLFLLKEKQRMIDRKVIFISNLKHLKRSGSHLVTPEESTQIEQGIFPQFVKEDWKVELKRANLPPKSSDHKKRITTWMMYWVMSVLGTVLGDFLSQAFNAIYNLMSSLYDRMSKHVFGNVEE